MAAIWQDAAARYGAVSFHGWWLCAQIRWRAQDYIDDVERLLERWDKEGRPKP